MNEFKQHIMEKRLDGRSPFDQHSSEEESEDNSNGELSVKGPNVDYLRIDSDTDNMDEMDSQGGNL